MTFDREGYVYVADHGYHFIKKFTPKGQYISQFGSGEIGNSCSIVIDDNNVIFISKKSNNRVSIFETNGHYIDCFGKLSSGDVEFDRPLNITIDSSGVVYINDTWNDRPSVVVL